MFIYHNTRSDSVVFGVEASTWIKEHDIMYPPSRLSLDQGSGLRPSLISTPKRKEKFAHISTTPQLQRSHQSSLPETITGTNPERQQKQLARWPADLH